MNLDKKNMKNIMLLIVFAVLVYVGIQRADVLLVFLKFMISILVPFLVGGALAFVLNVPMHFMENKLFGKAKQGSRLKKAARPVSLLCSLLLVVCAILLVVLVVVPELGQTVMSISANIEASIPRFQNWLQNTFGDNKQIAEWISGLEFDWNTVIGAAIDFLKNGAGNVLNSTVAVAKTLVNVVMNFFIAFVFSCYILLQKEKLSIQLKKVFYALMPGRIVKKVMDIASLGYRTFSNFVTGQCLEAVILGTMFFVAMSLLKFPYAMLIGVLIAFTALIPIFGAFIGCVVGTFLIMVADPMKGIGFIILFLILQQIEGNLIYPRVVGGSVGLPSIWVLVAVTVGGSLMGVVGMLVFIPLSSVLYALFRGYVYKRLEEKGIHDI